ncbi:MAG TPA: divergent polysaccharide deacetylase family protein [Kiloniellales bacterium]|nr:divergent polysaccharide deacetylase family protein [Kiloniellales bacterium]
MAFRWRFGAQQRQRVHGLAASLGGGRGWVALAVPTVALVGLLLHLLDEPTRYQQAAAAVVDNTAPKPLQGPPAPPSLPDVDLLPAQPAEEGPPIALHAPPAPPVDTRLFLAEPFALPVASPPAESVAAVPQWRRNAVAVDVAPAQPRIAIVIDDLGPGRALARRAIDLSAPLTLAFLPYAEGLAALTAEARAAGHELLVHLPMEPIDLAHNNPGPNALMTGLEAAEIEARLAWGLARFDGYVGVNNHMGSAFTTDAAGLKVLMQALHERGLLFLDSRTVGGSLAEATALAEGVPALGRDVFLDNEANDAAAIWAQLRQVERIARERGQAVAIGHPHPATLEALAAWLPQVQAEGFALVPVSALVAEPASDQIVRAER